jgi:hypothetical protein
MAVFARQLAELTATEVNGRKHQVNVTEAHQSEFDKRWQNANERHHWCNAKVLLSRINTWLDSNGHSSIGADQLARGMTADEIPDEMIQVVNTAEALLRT